MDNTEPGGIPREQAGRTIQNKGIIVFIEEILLRKFRKVIFTGMINYALFPNYIFCFDYRFLQYHRIHMYHGNVL